MEDSLLFTPLRLGKYILRNRVAVPAMADFGAAGEDGLVNDRHLRHYTAFARGGAGLIVTEACTVIPWKGDRNALQVYEDSCLPGFRKLAEKIRDWEGVCLVQLVCYENSGKMPAAEMMDCFAAAARRVHMAGFAGVELHAAHGFWLNSLLETDPAGIGLVCDLIRRIHQECGEDFLAAVRLGDSDLHRLKEHAALFEKAGCGLLDISTGSRKYEKPEDFSFDPKIYAASLVKKNAGVPVMAVGGIEDGKTALAILENQYADLVAVGKGHLCDPAWADKVCYGNQPDKCLHCDPCRWYIDGRECPVSSKNNKRTRLARFYRNNG